MFQELKVEPYFPKTRLRYETEPHDQDHRAPLPMSQSEIHM